jgi:TetR/AcrR family transcriptional repressor of nem operon
MRGAGLTVGGFYAHFASKDAMVDETIRRTFAELKARLFERLEGTGPLETVLRRYLSRSHRDDLSGGCPLPAIAGEIATGGDAHRDTLVEELEAVERDIEALLPRTSKLSQRQLALGFFALLVGGLTLARAVRGTSLSDDVLRSARAFARAALESLEKGA